MIDYPKDDNELWIECLRIAATMLSGQVAGVFTLMAEAERLFSETKHKMEAKSQQTLEHRVAHDY